MKYYVYRTEIDTMSGYRHSTYLKAVEAIQERESLLSTFNVCDDVDGYPVGTFEATDDKEAIECFHYGYSTEHVKGCGNSHAFMEYTLYRGPEVEAMLKFLDSDEYDTKEPPYPGMLDFSTSDMFDEEDEDQED